MLAVRETYGCDCDSVDRDGGSLIDRRASDVVNQARSWMGAIKNVIGVEQFGCPWRGFYRPIVAEVIEIASLSESGLSAARLGADPPAVLLDALSLYLRCRAMSIAHHTELVRAKSKT